MYVVKRDGQQERMQFDKVTARLDGLMWGLDRQHVLPELVTRKIAASIFSGITTREIDELAADMAAYMVTQHPDYAVLAARILVSNLHKQTPTCFSESMESIDKMSSEIGIASTGEQRHYFTPEFMSKVRKHAKVLDAAVDHNRDYLYDFFAIKTLLKNYLSVDEQKRVLERPQYLLMRVALALHLDNISAALETYKLLSEGKYIHATPTLFNAGKEEGQLSSCFLLQIPDDSLRAIYSTLTQCAMISKYSGGIGVSVHKIRSTGSLIKSSRGQSSGLIPMLRVYNDTARYVDQCFEPTTLVYTKTGPKAIGDVAPLDELVTADGSFFRVAKVLHYSHQGEVLRIGVQHCPMTRVTRQHPFLAITGVDATHEAGLLERLEGGLVVPEYVEAGSLRVGDLVAFAIPTYECDVPDYSVDDCRLWGLMIGHGGISGGFMYIDHPPADGFVQQYLNTHCIEYRQTTGEIPRIEWPIPKYFKVTRQLLYNYQLGGTYRNKTIPSHLLHLPRDKTMALLQGCGYCTELGVLHLVRYLWLRMGSLGLSGDQTGVIRHRNFLYARVISVEVHSSYWGELIDLEMVGNPNYLTDVGVAHNGGGKRKGGVAIYLEPWHADIFAFLDLRKNTGLEHERCRDLFTALWIPDLFMKRVKADEKWSLFSNDTAPGLCDVYGEEFETLYKRYEDEGRAREVVQARKVWDAILDSCQKTGTPYMLYKDACNRKSNQKNLGTLQSSNLCAEILEYTSADEVAVCNLGSVNYAAFVKYDSAKKPYFDFDELHAVAYLATKNLDRVIDVTFYPIPEARRSNLRHRPIGLGDMGLADAFQLMKLPYTSEGAKQLNRDIAETMYHAAMQASADMAVLYGPYYTFWGSPASQGILQFDMWNVKPSGRYNWNVLRNQIQKTGLRNSLVRATMPTATTSQIMGRNESIEPHTSNMYVRRTLAGEFIVLNKNMVRDLQEQGLWTEVVIKKLIRDRGSLQSIDEVPADLKDLYRTVWEIPMRDQIDMAADRGAFICQTQSFNVHMADPTKGKLTAMHFYAWEKGLKTGQYYYRTQAAAEAIQFTVDHSLKVAKESDAPEPADEESAPTMMCTRDSGCTSCQ